MKKIGYSVLAVLLLVFICLRTLNSYTSSTLSQRLKHSSDKESLADTNNHINYDTNEPFRPSIVFNSAQRNNSSNGFDHAASNYKTNVYSLAENETFSSKPITERGVVYHPSIVFDETITHRRESLSDPYYVALDNYEWTMSVINSRLQQSPPFNNLVDVLSDYGYGYHTRRVAELYNCLIDYYRVLDRFDKSGMELNEFVPDTKHTYFAQLTTWEQYIHSRYKLISTTLRNPHILLPNEQLMDYDVSLAITEQLLFSISKESLYEYERLYSRESFGPGIWYLDELKHGDQLIMQ